MSEQKDDQKDVEVYCDFKYELLDFPDEILVNIMTHLTVDGFCNLLFTCKDLHRFSDEDWIWEQIVKNQTPNLYPYKPQQENYKWLCLVSNQDRVDSTFDRFYGGKTRHGEIYGTAIKLAGSNLAHLGAPDIRSIKSGTFYEGKLHGYGICWFKNGNRYEGEWKHGKQDGNGKMFWTDEKVGDYYEGEWKDDHRHGQGKYVWSKGSSYTGNFQMNDLEGFGVYTFKSGQYIGNWNDSTRHGQGIIKWNNGNQYEGSFVRNRKHGHGIYTWVDGAIYDGDWVEDDRSGEAVTTWANGMSYQGSYKNDLRNGYGVLVWPDGDMYKGRWKDGGRWGSGIFTSDGKTTEQCWQEEPKTQYSKQLAPKHP